ncbi:hypothetical protein, partial [Streptomyces geysiriensis]|uniref:hypothetical protein n=1 Tax=Streptomyces geysiriensis TaxID=68207 RepID=UPI001C7CFDB5
AIHGTSRASVFHHSASVPRSDGRGAGQQCAAPGEQLILLHDSSVARRGSGAPEKHRGGGTEPPARTKIGSGFDNLTA